MNTNIKTYKLLIKGRVQGVGFRNWFSNLANTHRLNGYVKNLKNSDEVEALVQGEIKNIEKIIEKSEDGPVVALVEKVIPNEITNYVAYSCFKIKYDN